MSSGVACAIFLFHHIRLLSVFQITNLREYEKHALFMCFLCAFFYLQLMYHKILAPIDWTTKRRNNCKIKLRKCA